MTLNTAVCVLFHGFCLFQLAKGSCEDTNDSIVSQMNGILQSVQAAASKMESLLSVDNDQLQQCSIASQCLTSLAGLAANSSTVNADMYLSLKLLEKNFTSLVAKVEDLNEKYKLQEEFSVSVAGEGGCCTGGEHKGPWFQVNGKEHPFGIQRGLNIVAVSRTTGHVVKGRSFDTYSVENTDAQNLVRFIQHEIPDDSVVLVAGYDAFSTHCKQFSDCQEALRSLGARQTEFKTRDSYALIGYKGSCYGNGIKPEWVKDGYFAYPGETARGGQQSPPVTLHATIKKNTC